ncbi:hypothetical protein C8J56DRAFT_979520 [Mycena floridula]|nr:hypothetical protein C8J56DRAFT_979520 [Mycena floridula]
MDSLPSPADSPPLNPTDSVAIQPSRKRQRSHSMQSDTSSSSTKRTVSESANHENGRSPRAEEMSTLSLSESTDMDSYMAEQGEVAAQSASIPTSTSPSMSPLAKLGLILALEKSPLGLNQTWFIVDTRWMLHFEAACKGVESKDGFISEDQLGPVDNTTIIDQNGILKIDLLEDVEMRFIPEEAWNHLVAWYGKPPHPLPRRTYRQGLNHDQSPIVALELHPPQIMVLKLTKNKDSIAPPSRQSITLSCQDTIKTLRERLAAAVNPEPQFQNVFRVWSVEAPGDEFDQSNFPLSDLASCSPKLLEDSDKTLEDEQIGTGSTFVVEFQEEGQWIADEAAILQPGPLFKPGTGFFQQFKNTSTTSTSLTNYFSSPKTFSALTNGRSGPSNTSNLKTLHPGTLGLGNMGNTCFMNSALQCLAHSQELSDYFLTGVFKDELNPDNPLGMQGAIAEAFGALLERIWATSGPGTSYSPREFKTQLQRFAPQFHGYQQHDSQELVAFLLDGLHEDLNRVLEKPYVEKPDWEGGGDLELVQLARKSWEGYMKRNDSVIVDLFQGQYQSTLICPECNKVSITFDPFMYLTLPLPVQKKWKHNIYYVPWDDTKEHVLIPVEINRDASFRDLRVLLARWMGTNPDNLLTMETFSHKFYKSLDDHVLCSEMADNDSVVCYELPCHARQSRNFKKSPDDPFIVPVFLSEASFPTRSSYTMNMHSARHPALFGYPHMARKSMDDIYACIIADLYSWEEVGHSRIKQVPINGAPIIDAITEITENGDIVTVQAPPAEEGDIAEAKVIDEKDDDSEMEEIVGTPMVAKRQPKPDLFNMRLQSNRDNSSPFTALPGNSESWDKRKGDSTLLRENDHLYLEFDEHMKSYYFGEERRYENSRWVHWNTFIHPEYEAARKEDLEKQSKGISIQDCLDEFTKEEQLGQDDLWYCPACKKHQQATKKFDLWKAPDILVVHLKRFSNSRMLRDKIDAFIDFPVEGLDLGHMVGERKTIKKLLDKGVVLDGLTAENLDEPLLYDLFGVDEHLGGLGGGHYRAYARHHIDDKWYHFDDSYVTEAQAKDAVNANAYLLFYRRRTATPLGGKSHQKTEEARRNPKKEEPIVDDKTNIQTQLPTPPSEKAFWQTPPGSQAALPSFADSIDTELISLNSFDEYSTPPNRNSPTSSNEAEGPGSDQELDDRGSGSPWSSSALSSSDHFGDMDDDIQSYFQIRKIL